MLYISRFIHIHIQYFKNIEKKNFNLENYIIKLIKETRDYRVKPQNDYYTYTNGRWIDLFKSKKEQYYITKKDD